jgi:cell division protein FtsB
VYVTVYLGDVTSLDDWMPRHFISFLTRLTMQNVKWLQHWITWSDSLSTIVSINFIYAMESPYVAIQPRDGNANLASSIAVQEMANHVVQNQVGLMMIKSEDQLRREKRRQKKWTVLIATISLIGFFVALSAIIVEGSYISYLAFVFPIVLGPYVIHQRRKLNKLPTLVYVMNQIRDQINRLMMENAKLFQENTRLEQQITMLQDAEMKLEAVIQKSGHNVDTICTLVQQNAETQRQMKVCTVLYFAV